MPRRMRRRHRRKTKFVTRRALPFLLMKQAEAKRQGDSVSDETLSVSTPVDFDLSVIAQGNAVGQRIGNSVQATGFIGNFTFSVDTVIAETSPKYARILLWMPRGDSNVLPPNVSPTEFPDPEQYIIWVDRRLPLPWTNSITNSQATIKKKFKPYMLMNWDSAINTSCIKGKLQCTVVSDSTSGAALVTADLRLYYRDV